MTQDPNTQMLEGDPQLVEMSGELFIAKFFQYVANFAGLVNNNSQAQGTQNITIDSDADFQLLYLIGSRDNVPLTMQVTEGGAGGLAWSSAAVNWDNLFGTAQLPFPVGLIPQLLPRKRVYTLVALNTSGGTINAQGVLTGYKLFPANQAAQVGAKPTQ